MKKSLIWITAGVATVGFAVPAFAAHGSAPRHDDPAVVTLASVATTTANSVQPTIATTTALGDNATQNSVDDNATQNSVEDNATQNSVDDNATDNSVDDATENSVDDDATESSVDDDATENSVEDVSGPCDEAEHANDPRCTNVSPTVTDDNSGHGGGSDDSGHGGSDD
ncbi:MAG TPA: hypothetical protein VGC84_19705 [Ilumatobacteraceae bacterium]